MQSYDVIIIGAGHAGTEAAAAAYRLGRRVLIITKAPSDFGALSCNPSIGGPGKSQMIAEIAAMGGVMSAAADRAGIHFRMLNSSQGPATRALRAQIDRILYHKAVMDKMVGIDVIYESVNVLDLEKKTVNGKYAADAVVIAVGTFLNGLVIRGDERIASGRLMDNGVYQENTPGITDILRTAGFEIIRLKTGTPSRLYADSIDFSKCEVQAPDENHEWFSSGIINYELRIKNYVNCHITHTTEATHQIIRDNIKNAPMYNGNIRGIGPRYCPSIEDKVMRFPEHLSHHVFLEPESADGGIIYPAGISTSFGADVQDMFLRSIPGLSNVRVARYGYAIEYDAIDARELTQSLESKKHPGVYFAGQINGTSGYEEAAGQGIIAGYYAALNSRDCTASRTHPDTNTLVIDRANSMIGVMIDDITTNGIDEPYRMFSSRAEYRLSLRADNAIARIGDMARAAGLITDEQYEAIYAANRAKIEATDALYAGYIKQQNTKIERMRADKLIKLPPDLDYSTMSGLTNELRQKLGRLRPEAIADAVRIQGMTPAAILILLSHAKAKKLKIVN